MNAPVPHPRNAGFTLLEVMIATTLLAVMMLLLTGSLRIGASSWDAGEERITRASRMFIVQNFLRSHIGSLLPVTTTLSDGQIVAVFRGGSDSLEYVAPMPEQVNRGGLYKFNLYLARNGDTKDLRVAILPYVAPSGAARRETVEPVDDLALLENVDAFRLSYLGPASPMASTPQLQGTRELTWTEDWTQGQPPILIRIDIEPENEAPWPSLVLAPRTQAIR